MKFIDVEEVSNIKGTKNRKLFNGRQKVSMDTGCVFSDEREHKLNSRKKLMVE